MFTPGAPRFPLHTLERQILGEPLSEEERAAFLTSVQEEEALEREARGVPLSLKLSRSEQATIDRTTIRRALVAQGILNIRKRRVALTLKSIFRAEIS